MRWIGMAELRRYRLMETSLTGIGAWEPGTPAPMHNRPRGYCFLSITLTSRFPLRVSPPLERTREVESTGRISTNSTKREQIQRVRVGKTAVNSPLSGK